MNQATLEVTAPKLLWKGDYLDGNLEIFIINTEGNKRVFEFNLTHDLGNSTYNGVAQLNIANFTDVNHMIDCLMVKITQAYTEAVATKVKEALANGDINLQ